MSELKLCLFRRFSIARNGQTLKFTNSQKAKELFCYLLIYRNQSHHREILADKLWRGIRIKNTRKYLRKAVWQLQSSLNSIPDSRMEDVLSVEPEWLRVDAKDHFWLDIAFFEEEYQKVRKIKGKDLTKSNFISLRKAVDKYEGDLLEGWYQSWCIFERERFKEMLIAMIGKLMMYCEVNQDYESGIDYGIRLLRYDRAHERTHRRLMRIQYLAGDRTSAIRQYNHCKEVLKEELSVETSQRTNQLFQEISRGDEVLSRDLVENKELHSPSSNSAYVIKLSQIINRMINQVNEQEEIIYEIKELENELKKLK